MTNFAKPIIRGENVDEGKVKWINCDTNDLGFERLTDGKIKKKDPMSHQVRKTIEA